MYYLTEEDYAVAKSNGIPRNLAYNRYYNYDYDLKRAITEPVRSSSRSTPNMKLWEEWKEVAESNGICKTTFYARLNIKVKKPWTPEQAATRPLNIRSNRKIKPEIYELAKQNGINIKTLQSRVCNLNWNPYRAATQQVDSALNWRAH